MIKSPLLALLLLAAVPLAAAAPPSGFEPAVRNFAKSKGMVFQGLSQTGSDGQPDKNVWTYSFENQNEVMAVTFEHVKRGQTCLPKPYFFGDLPLTVAGRKAVFSSPALADPLAKVRDVLYTDNGKGGCYSVSYGFKGSRFDDAVRLMAVLLEK